MTDRKNDYWKDDMYKSKCNDALRTTARLLVDLKATFPKNLTALDVFFKNGTLKIATAQSFAQAAPWPHVGTDIVRNLKPRVLVDPNRVPEYANSYYERQSLDARKAVYLMPTLIKKFEDCFGKLEKCIAGRLRQQASYLAEGGTLVEANGTHLFTVRNYLNFLRKLRNVVADIARLVRAPPSTFPKGVVEDRVLKTKSEFQGVGADVLARVEELHDMLPAGLQSRAFANTRGVYRAYAATTLPDRADVLAANLARPGLVERTALERALAQQEGVSGKAESGDVSAMLASMQARLKAARAKGVAVTGQMVDAWAKDAMAAA